MSAGLPAGEASASVSALGQAPGSGSALASGSAFGEGSGPGTASAPGSPFGQASALGEASAPGQGREPAYARAADPGSPAAAPRSGLRRFTGPRAAVVERCELCGAPVAPEHRHLVDLDRRALACACPACAALFDRDGSGGVRYRAVPRRYLVDPAGPLDEAVWASLRIPIGVAFLLHNSALGQVVACFPGPAGVTESEIEPQVWQRFADATPLAAELRPDVEALLVRRTGGHRDCHLVPVDAAYELVGRMRTLWQGFDGGAEANAALDAFFADVARHSRALAPAKGAAT